MKITQDTTFRLLQLCSLLKITNENHADEIIMLKMEAESIIEAIEKDNKKAPPGEEAGKGYEQ